jgi:type II secretion system protein H
MCLALALIANWVEQGLMQISATKQSGFSLLELLVVISILGFILSMATLALPNNDEKLWKQDVQELIATLNQAREEVAMSGAPIRWISSSQGWSFRQINLQGDERPLGDPLQERHWRLPSTVTSTDQLIIGQEVFASPMIIEVKHDKMSAKIQREKNGRFKLVNPS